MRHRVGLQSLKRMFASITDDAGLGEKAICSRRRNRIPRIIIIEGQGDLRSGIVRNV